jgi:hypothetical protein
MPKKKKTSGCGACSYVKITPKAKTKVPRKLNLFVTFQEALKLKAAIDEVIHRLNLYNHATKEGKAACLKLTIDYVGMKHRIVIFEDNNL